MCRNCFLSSSQIRLGHIFKTLRFLSLRYSTDFRRSRLVFFSELTKLFSSPENRHFCIRVRLCDPLLFTLGTIKSAKRIFMEHSFLEVRKSQHKIQHMKIQHRKLHTKIQHRKLNTLSHLLLISVQKWKVTLYVSFN